MGSLSRKISRKKKLKSAKSSKKNLKKALNATMGIPTACSSCSASFDPIKDADTWMIFMEKDRDVLLECPDCHKTI